MLYGARNNEKENMCRSPVEERKGTTQHCSTCFVAKATKKQRETTGILKVSIEMTAFDINGNFVPTFMKTFQDAIDLDDNINSNINTNINTNEELSVPLEMDADMNINKCCCSLM